MDSGHAPERVPLIQVFLNTILMRGACHMRRVSRPLRGLVFAGRLAASTILFTNHAFALKGDYKLPAPYVSRALEAVLLPIDAQVRKAFKLKKKDHGVLVLSVEPGGTAEKRGIMAGDVLSDIKGHKIKKPIDVDTVVYYWGKKGQYDFPMNYYRNGVVSHGGGIITFDDYSTAIDIASIGSWAAWSFATAFSYSEYYSEFSAEFSASYESSESLIIEIASSEEFAAEIANEAKIGQDRVPDGIDPDETASTTHRSR